jgi:hypothetical protein
VLGDAGVLARTVARERRKNESPARVQRDGCGNRQLADAETNRRSVRQEQRSLYSVVSMSVRCRSVVHPGVTGCIWFFEGELGEVRKEDAGERSEEGERGRGTLRVS